MTTTHQPGETTMEAHLSFKALCLIVALAVALGVSLDERALPLVLQIVSLLAAR